eukprot:TRINITY_DN9851_c0_g1_i3.p2 TRINITY_DN9851_c0_g1~~TRINITY_DN9851_c0_g1_i3.p2  ORF type:complete len:155 (+),score=24.32 TRINITY_DN9851_c0_g1_i3:63-467(+)
MCIRDRRITVLRQQKQSHYHETSGNNSNTTKGETDFIIIRRKSSHNMNVALSSALSQRPALNLLTESNSTPHTTKSSRKGPLGSSRTPLAINLQKPAINFSDYGLSPRAQVTSKQREVSQRPLSSLSNLSLIHI